ncbi:putative bifunctional diguanylate cyclase/phosphodiesterase [Pseudomonas sp. 5P_3.1_Bac2]|uniref:putative bifunctional diguanylate cyclase/phosphodiesterase n=1 Tax=Pseudomonas sp. 5P_3.1_Bac2 TaxID=2971617 RepID=UPI0021C8CEC7|nr:EAL domain-containing protein [Pseudomonas sp. 5P_3.1_Bac2]MCU1715544.1 EAL domain-containing protein [Pseudomonas sp. 5P_3.1_Bac2]
MQSFQGGSTDHPTLVNANDLALTQSAMEVLEALPHRVWAMQGERHYHNRRWREAFGSAAENWLEAVCTTQRAQVYSAWQQALSSNHRFSYECRMRMVDGSYRWCLLLADVQTSDSDGPPLWWLTCTDIDDRVAAQLRTNARLKMLDDMLDASVDCIKVLDTHGRVVHMNRSGCRALGVSAETGFGMPWLPLLGPAVRKRGQAALNKARAGRSARFAGLSGCGPTQQSWDNILTPLRDPDSGAVEGILCVSRDVTAQLEVQRRLRVAVERDELTGLHNRLAFRRHLRRALQRARESRQRVGVLLLDLDHFKHVNDTLGHPAGDHLLQVLGQRLSAWAPSHVFVARLGGDEFSLVVRNDPDEQMMADLAAQLLTQLDAVVTYAGRSIKGGMSIGWAMYPDDAPDSATLMKCADRALNDLKAAGRGSARRYTAELLAHSEAKLQQMNLCRVVISEDRVVPYYQPKVRLCDGALIGFEALLRWRSACGVELPYQLAEAFNHYDLASQLDAQMHNKVLADMAGWLRQGLSLVPVSMNVAPMEFLRDDYAELFLQRIAAHGIAAHWVELEVTEHMLEARGADYVLRALHLLKARGVRITLDDFGSGHSSFNRLRDYPVDCLKLDYDFISRLEHEPHVRAIVRAITQLGPSLNLDIVAEGIESESQRELLLEAGCEIGQGLLFSAPLDAAQAQALMCRCGPRLNY